MNRQEFHSLEVMLADLASYSDHVTLPRAISLISALATRISRESTITRDVVCRLHIEYSDRVKATILGHAIPEKYLHDALRIKVAIDSICRMTMDEIDKTAGQVLPQ